MKNGLYRNKVGSELQVLWPVMAIREFRSLGDTYEAVTIEEGPFRPMSYIVTDLSLANAGYEFVSEVVSS